MSSTVMQLVEREMNLLEITQRVDHEMAEAQSTADFFTGEDREKLYYVYYQLKQILVDLGELKTSGQRDLSAVLEALKTQEVRIRTLEDDRLRLRTEISVAAATSKLWITVISTLAAGGVSLLIKLIWH